MRLRNIQAHMKGQVISVNGRNYQIEQSGEVTIKNPEDAAKLLRGSSWKVISQDSEVEKPKLEVKIERVEITEIEPKPELAVTKPKKSKKTKKR